MNLKAWQHILGPQNLYRRWTYTHYIKLPGWKYDSSQTFRHRDNAGRVKQGPLEDRYLHHVEGRLRKLIVACSDDLFEGPDNTTWRRTYIRMVSPLRVRIATWVIDFSYDPKSWDDWWIMLLRALPAAFAMSFFVSAIARYFGVQIYVVFKLTYLTTPCLVLGRLARAMAVQRLLRAGAVPVLRHAQGVEQPPGEQDGDVDVAAGPQQRRVPAAEAAAPVLPAATVRRRAARRRRARRSRLGGRTPRRGRR